MIASLVITEQSLEFTKSSPPKSQFQLILGDAQEFECSKSSPDDSKVQLGMRTTL